MRTSLAAFALLSLASPIFGGCPTHVLSPPTQFMPLESARPLEAGRTSIGLEGGVASEVFGPEIPGGSLVVRRGFADDLELRVDGTAAWVTGDNPGDEFRGILSGRVGLKGLIAKDFPHAAWFAGIGGGGSAGGGFLSADSGVIFAYENPYIVPFLRMALFTSVPVGAREVDISRMEDGDFEETFDTPHTTFGFRLGLGARIPLDPIDITFGLSMAHLLDTRGEEIGLFGVSGGISTSF